MYQTLILLLILLLSTATVPAAASKPADGERLLLIRSAGGNASEQEQIAQSGIYDSMVEYLTDRGYRVVDRSLAEQASMQIAATHEIDPVVNKAAAYGLQFLAEYTIHFKTSTLVKDPEKGIGALVRVSAKVVDNTGARIITAKTADASSTGHSTADAVEKAARTAGKRLTEQLARGIEQHIKQTGIDGRTVTMVLEGPDALTARLTSLLEKSLLVATVKEVEAGGNKSTLEIISKVRRDQLERELLRMATQQGITLQKIRAEGNRSTWKIR